MSFEHAISPGRRSNAADVSKLLGRRPAYRVLLFLSALMASLLLSAATWAQSDTGSGTTRLHVALGSLIGHAYPDISERVIGEVLAEGADPLASIEYGLVTAHQHRDSFSYLINIAEIAAAREEAGETDHLPDDWRARALRYHDAMAAAADAPDAARYYLERVVGPAHAEEATDEYSSRAAELAALIRRDANEVNRAMNDATGDGETLAEWQKYERDAYGNGDWEIDW